MSGHKTAGSTVEAGRAVDTWALVDGEEFRNDAATVTGATQVVADEAGRVATTGPPAERDVSDRVASEFDVSVLNAADAEPAATALSPAALRRRLILADVAALVVGIACGIVAQDVFGTTSRSDRLDQLGLLSASLPVFVLAAGFNRLYQARANARRIEEAMNIVKTVATGMGALLLIALVVQHRDLSRLWVGSTAIGITGAALVERRIAHSMFKRLRQKGRTQRRIIMIGTDEHAVNLVEAYDSNPDLGYKVVGFVGAGDAAVEPCREVLGTADDLEDLLIRHDAVGVVMSLNSVPAETVNVLTRRITDLGYHVVLSSSLRDIDAARLRTQTQDGRTMIYVERTRRGGWRRAAKRIFDLALATFILALTLPLQLCAAIAVAATSRGSILFRQIRVGQDGELFEVLKFRTMYEDAESRLAGLMGQNEADGPLFKMRNDPRVTGVGRIMRKLSIDELPQLLCVIRGSMSMVGPRPALPNEVEQWDIQTRDRLRVPPGLTGMWQVSGRSNNSFETYKRLDLYYVDNWSLWHDLTICARTVGVVLSGSGAS